MKDEIRIRLSVGLIVVAVLHAVLLGAVFSALHRTPKPQPKDEWQLPTARPTPQVGRQIEKLPEPAQVNLEAQGELKQQSGYCPPSCPPVVRPTIRPYRVVPNRPVVKPSTPAPSTVPAPTVPAPIIVTPTNSTGNTVPETTSKRYQIALFVGNDARSQQLLDWFNEDAKLSKLRQSCEFQVYTQSNALYKTRFADIVSCQPVPCRSLPGFKRRSRSRGWLHDVAIDSGGTLRRFALRLRTLSSDSASPENRSPQVARLFLGFGNLANPSALPRRLPRRLLPDRTNRAHMAAVRSGP